MDPIATWNSILDALRSGAIDDAVYAADDLAEWLRKGGYRPDDVPFAHELLQFRKVLSALLRTLAARG